MERFPFHGLWSGESHMECFSPFTVYGWNSNSISNVGDKAIRFALINHSCVMFATDNTTVTSYINKQGGTYYPNL